MDDNQDQKEVVPQDLKNKKVIERSAAYPAYTIEESLNFVAEIYKHFRNSFAKREDIVRLIDGTTNSKIASCGHYGLLDREKDTYKITEIYKTIVNHLTEIEKRQALLEAFYSPTLNKELIAKFDGDVIPDKLSVHLYRFHRITEIAAPIAADVFVRNAKYVGVYSDENKLCYDHVINLLNGASSVSPKIPVPDGDQDKPIAVPEIPIDNIKTNIHSPAEPIKAPSLLPESTNEEKLAMKLTDGRRAYLSYPRDLNEKDIAILKLQLDALALSI